MTEREIRDALAKMMKEREEQQFSETRKPTETEVRQSRIQFSIHPQKDIPSFTLGCAYCNTGYEDDYYADRVGERMMHFFEHHASCRPGSKPPERGN